MKTLEQIKTMYKSNTLDGRDIGRLGIFIATDELKNWDLELDDKANVKNRKPLPFTKENVIEQLKSDVAFGFEKALNRRSISASIMYKIVNMWNWILEDGLEDITKNDELYPMYGLPLFKATALKYGFENPIGEDNGSEDKYNR